MNDLTAAIGREQLKKLKKFNNKKIFIIKKYLKNIKNIKNIKPIIPYELNKSSYWIFGIRTTKRDSLIKFLKKFNIATGVHFYPLSLQSFFKKYNGECPKAHKIWKSILTLPLHYTLTKDDIDFITTKIKIFFNRSSS